MAVQEQTPLQEYTANGITKQFDLEFDCESADHLIVSINDLEVLHTDWYLSGNSIVFHVAPASGKQVKIQRNTPFNRLADYQSYNNSFRPPAINKDLDRLWWKLQELGVADWILHNRIDALKAYVDQQDSELQQNIDNLKIYVDDKDDELRAYLMEEIRKQGVALDQLDDYYNYLMQRLAQIAVDKGWDASFIVDGNNNQHEINAEVISASRFSSLEAADTEAFRRNKPLILRDQTFTLTRNTIIASETFIESGALINLNGFNLTFNRDVHAGEYQIFIGSTKVTGNKISKAYSDWFAPAADGYEIDPTTADEVNKTYVFNNTTYAYGVSPSVTFTDDTAKLQQLININAKETIITDRGIYMINATGNNPYDTTRGGLLFRDKVKGQILRIEGKLKAIPNNKANTNVLRWYNNHGVHLIGNGSHHIIGDLFENPLMSAEGGMGAE